MICAFQLRSLHVTLWAFAFSACASDPALLGQELTPTCSGSVCDAAAPSPGAQPDASTNDGSPASTPSACSETERCARYTTQGPACLPACSPTAAENGASADAGGCPSGSLCVDTSGCCEGSGCAATVESVCCLLVDGAPSCGDVIEIFPPGSDAGHRDAGPLDASDADAISDASPSDALVTDAAGACSATERCAQYTANGQACLPTCVPGAAEAGAGANAGGCAAGSLCIETSGCCEGVGCLAILVSVCCPVVDGAPSCGDVVAVF